MTTYLIYASRLKGREAFSPAFENQHILVARVETDASAETVLRLAREEGVFCPVVERVTG